jgi:threonylcarbamoyladenosine tRNA methylthiotransferase MtaB
MSDPSTRMPRVALVALGCRVSRAERDALAADLRRCFEVVGEGHPAEYVVVNTCTVTGDAESSSRQAVRLAARRNPEARIVVAGCSAQLHPHSLAALPGVVTVAGSRSLTAVPELLRRLHAGEEPAKAWDCARQAAPAWAAGLDIPGGRTRPSLKVQDGCDGRCSYCVVPAARGPGRSMPLEEALARLRQLGERHAEVVLSGIHLGAYGRDLAPRSSLARLVREGAAQGAVRRLRLSSVEPMEFPLELLAEPEVRRILCEHFHVPLQSGSDRVLSAMRRPYRAHDYAEVIEEIAARLPGGCLGADVMVGFPGETDRDHRDTLRLLEALPLAYLHVFPWSPRPGTEAAAMPRRVAGILVRERAQELRAFSHRRWAEYSNAQVGRTAEVVVERVSGGWAHGTARQYLAVRWPATAEQRGAVVSIRLQGVTGSVCVGVR